MSLRVIISGAGVGGLTLAYWLERHRFEPIVLERAPGVRGGGYMIDFWGLGFDVAERMGLRERLARAHVDIPMMEMVDSHGRVKGRIPVRRLRHLIRGRHFNFLRRDLECALYEAVVNRVEIRFGTEITGYRNSWPGLEVELSNGTVESCDILVGADGLRSRTRRLGFGADDLFEKRLGYYAASFTLDNYLGKRDVAQLCTVPDKQVGLYSITARSLAAFFLFRTADHFGSLARETQAAYLTEVFRDVGWEAPRILERLGSAHDLYFDSVSQVELPLWRRGRLVLIGDACGCVSLISGDGAGLAMADAYVLAAELAREPSEPISALERYEAIMRPVVERRQRSAQRSARWFVPGSRFGIFARNAFLRLMRVPWLARYFVRRALAPDLSLDRLPIGTIPVARSAHDLRHQPSQV